MRLAAMPLSGHCGSLTWIPTVEVHMREVSVRRRVLFDVTQRPRTQAHAVRYHRCMADCDPAPQNQPVAGNKTGRMVMCTKFQKELPGLDSPPWPGELGQRIYQSVSVQAWQLWEERMKIILNEYRLMPAHKASP